MTIEQWHSYFNTQEEKIPKDSIKSPITALVLPLSTFIILDNKIYKEHHLGTSTPHYWWYVLCTDEFLKRFCEEGLSGAPDEDEVNESTIDAVKRFVYNDQFKQKFNKL